MPDIFIDHQPATLPKLRTPHSRFLRSFVHFPRNVRFDTQSQKENIVLLLRQHPIVNVPWIFLGLIFLFTPPLLSLVVIGEVLSPTYRLIGLILWYVFIFAYLFEHFLRWYYNVLIVTDQRLIDVDFPSLLYREMTEARLDHVEEVSNRKGGYLRSLFDFGDVLVQTAGAIPEIEIEDVPDPERVTKIIYDLIGKTEAVKTP